MVKNIDDDEVMAPKREGRKPGPKPTNCPWCNSISCSHCRCAGSGLCDHDGVEQSQCTRDRYKRRLVCNPCEKNKLKARLERNDREDAESDLNLVSRSRPRFNSAALSDISFKNSENHDENQISAPYTTRKNRERSKSMSSMSSYTFSGTMKGGDGINALLSCAISLNSEYNEIKCPETSSSEGDIASASSPSFDSSSFDMLLDLAASKVPL